MNTKTGKWEPLTHSVGPDVNEFRVPKLKEGEDYKFRVRAENDQGQSEPLDSDKATRVKNPFGTLFAKLTTTTLEVALVVLVISVVTAADCSSDELLLVRLSLVKHPGKARDFQTSLT